MKRMILTIFSIFALGAGAVLFRDNLNILGENTAFAVGGLVVDWGTSGPIFDVANMAPGEREIRSVKVENGGSGDVVVGVKGLREEETGGLGNVLEITISEEGEALYGPVTLTQFFEDSAAEGIELSEIGEEVSAEYTFDVEFLSDAGNEYQGKTVVFDIVFGEVARDTNSGGDVDIEISGNGAGSNNSVVVNISRNWSVVQKNISNIFNFVNTRSNTGGNVAGSNVGRSFIHTGNSNSNVQIINWSSFNFFSW